MPEIGELREAREIGKGGGGRHYIWGCCIKCGIGRWLEKWRGQPRSNLCRSCSMAGKKRARGSESSRWNGGRYLDSSGYINIKLQPDNFFFQMAGTNGYVYEHRLVVAKMLGRCLQPFELVHHKNGISYDNGIENLKLTTRGSHVIEHSKGYRDGYLQGFQDGRGKRIKELEVENAELRKLCQRQ